MLKVVKNIKKCYIFVEDSKKELFILLVLSLIITIISTIIPSLNGNIINKMTNGEYDTVIFLALLAGIFQVVTTVVNLVISKVYLVFRKKIVLDICKKTSKKIISMNVSTSQKTSHLKVINKIKDDSRKIVGFLNNIKESILLTISSIGILIYIFYLNKIIGIYYLLATILIVFIKYWGIKHSIYYKRMSNDLLDENSSILNEILQGSKDIKSLNLKETFVDKTTKSFIGISLCDYKSDSYIEYTNKISRLLESVISGCMIIISIILIKYNLLTTANFIIIFMYKSSVFNFSTKLSTLLNLLEQFNLSVERIFDILDIDDDKYGDKLINGIAGRITFKNVNFSYGDKNILHDFNLEIPANSFVGIIGPSGSGKSTILNLIAKMYNVDSGCIYIDDYDINSLSEESIRENISLVTQQPYIFNMSIKNNLDIIDDNISNIEQVIKLVGLEEKIKSLKDGYDTILESDATNLSGGEKQRLSIARILLMNTKIIMFDEVTSNLDKKSSKMVLDVIESLKGKYTIIMVTHDVDMTKNCDMVVSLEKQLR